MKFNSDESRNAFRDMWEGREVGGGGGGAGGAGGVPDGGVAPGF